MSIKNLRTNLYINTNEFTNLGNVVVYHRAFVYKECFTERHTPLVVFYEMVSTNNMDMVKYLIESGLVNMDDVDKERLFSLLWSMRQSFLYKDCEKSVAEYFLNFEDIRSYIFINRKRYPVYFKMIGGGVIPKHRFSGSGAVLK